MYRRVPANERTNARQQPLIRSFFGVLLWTFATLPLIGFGQQATDEIYFNRDIRPILSNNCFKCHGPDAAERKGGIAGLRLDVPEGAYEDLGGYAAVVPGKPEASELIRRVRSSNPAERMPPPESGKILTAQEVTLLERWIAAGARYEPHWSYCPVRRPNLPTEYKDSWVQNAVDLFILARLRREGLEPSPEADREALIRRVYLDLIGLPPTPEEVDAFLADGRPDAYERLVDRLLASPAFGEHWARMWLDLVRYADSAGYADDPPRTIWAYRDYVIRAFNANRPFDQFTIEQLAGDLLPNPTQEQWIATAMHRNTMTNNEGGTNDEEFRNAAVVDRVNTTFAVWMGTTVNCAQCHNHKYDPISQKEYFQLFAIFNTTQDADRRDESPVLEIWTDEQREYQARLQEKLLALRQKLSRVDAELREEEQKWEEALRQAKHWQVLVPESAVTDTGNTLRWSDDGIIWASDAKQETRTVVYPIQKPTRCVAIQIEALADPQLPGQGPGWAAGNFVLSGVHVAIDHGQQNPPIGRFVRIELPGQQRILSLAEVQVFRDNRNIATEGHASQSSTDFGGEARLAIDGQTDGRYYEGKSTTHTAQSDNPWWEVQLPDSGPIERVVVWNRTDNNLQSRLDGFRLLILDEARQIVWEHVEPEAPSSHREYRLAGPQPIRFASVRADWEQQGFPASSVLKPSDKQPGWAVAPRTGQSHRLTLIAEKPLEFPADSRLVVRLEHRYPHPAHVLGKWRVLVTGDTLSADVAGLPAAVHEALFTERTDRTEEQQKLLDDYFLATTPRLDSERQQLKLLEKQLAEMKPVTTVPIMCELPEGQRRITRIQRRGNFLDVGEVVEPGFPSAFGFSSVDTPPTRLDLARWLVDPRNPLTARVTANRFWEQLFGLGLVRTTEEFGAQGELPTHPELLDWLAAEFVESGWDMKQFLRLLVTSATYRQASRVTPELLQRDPENRLLARGPRFRLAAETIRDQALAVAGLLSRKMYGEPVRPVQPKLGVNAAFGSGIDWQPSAGEDRYRRGLYTMWRRSNPYPSMVTFDAPNREVCTLRRDRTNTPLQALVTLNDPVYVEAAQALARRIWQEAQSTEERIERGFRLCVARRPSTHELDRLRKLYEEARAELASHPEQARQLAGDLQVPTPQRYEAVELAAWTVVSNVLLNLDEFLMKR